MLKAPLAFQFFPSCFRSVTPSYASSLTLLSILSQLLLAPLHGAIKAERVLLSILSQLLPPLRSPSLYPPSRLSILSQLLLRSRPPTGAGVVELSILSQLLRVRCHASLPGRCCDFQFFPSCFSAVERGFLNLALKTFNSFPVAS